MPVVTIRTGMLDANGQEEVLSQYLCDSPDCPNVAEHVVGVVRELAAAVVICRECAELLRKRSVKPTE